MRSRLNYGVSASALAVAIIFGASGSALANDDVLALMADPANAVMPSISYNGWNYSTLDQINLANVADLQLAWTWQIGIQDSHEAPPLIVGDMMYIVSPKPNYVYALDLNRDGVIVWEFRPDMNVELATQQTCCGGQTRGIYYAEGKLFYATLDGQVFGLDAATGEALWRTVGVNISYGEGMAGNGIVANDLFIVGNEGGERGARGKVHAYDINTGNLQWVMYNMGPDNEVGITPSYQAFYPDNQTSLSTWYGDSWRRGGGTSWGYFTWNPDTNIFYYSTGNCGPWNPDYRREWGVINLDANGGMMDYQSNWCASQMARDATTGNLVWAFNITPADPWDLDEPLITPLINDLEINGQPRAVAIKAARTGYFFVWDQATGELVLEPWAHTYSTHITGYDMETGRAKINIDAWSFTNLEDRRRYTQADPGTRADGTQVADYTGTEIYWCPGTAARNWENDAYSPRTGLLYTATNTNCATQVVLEGEYTPGEGYTLRRAAGAAQTLGMGGVPITHLSEVQANSPTESRTVWRIIQQTQADQPLMATAGDLVFQGTENDGTMKAYNAMTGEVVWTFRTGSRFNATSVTYIGPDGRQYVAIIASSAATNGAVALDAAADNANRYRRSGSTLYVWALPETVAAN